MAKGSIDRRVARSRAMLHQALLSLIVSKGYEAITVENICETANVGRSTFYAHFAGKDDLKRSGLQHLRQHLLEQPERAAGCEDPRGFRFSLTMFEHARDHIHLYRALVGNQGGVIALGTIRQILCDCIRNELATIGDKKSKDNIPSEFTVQYVVGAYMAVLTWWLDSGAELPPRSMDAMFQRLAVDGIRCPRAA